MFLKALTVLLSLFGGVAQGVSGPNKTGTIVMMSSIGTPESYYANVECPFVPSPENYAIQIPDPECDIPLQTFYEGREARRFQQRHGVVTGDKVSFQVDVKEPIESNTTRDRCFSLDKTYATPDFKLKDIRVISKSKQKEYFTGQPIRLRSIVYLLDICNMRNVFRGAGDYMKYISQSVPGSSGDAMQRMYGVCSYNKTLYNPDDTIVLGPINTGCNGTIFRGSLRYDYSWDKCGAAEQFRWIDYAEEYARNMSVVGNDATSIKLRNLLSYTPGRRAIVILPPGTKCPWAGLATVGCATSRCVVYIKGEHVTKVPIVYHEMQHTMGLSHATFNRQEYGDRSCPMGQANAAKSNMFICNNAPYMFRLGWASAIANLSMDTMMLNTPVSFDLPATSSSDRNFIRLVSALSTNAGPVYYISYRAGNALSGYDMGLPNDLNKKVFVHVYNGSINARDMNRTALITWGDANSRFSGVAGSTPVGIWTSPALSGFGVLRLRVVSNSDTQASVRLCRGSSAQDCTSV